MAIDGQPAEPFLARNGAVVLAPGTRVDTFIDATAPAGTTSSILLHDGKESHPIGRLVISSEPPIRAAPALPLLRSLKWPADPARPQERGAHRFGAGRTTSRLGNAREFRKICCTRVPRQDRPHRGAGAVEPRRGPAVFHLHGHHFRLLDRLDDGWKPFWLDTLAIDPGMTQRIAFAAEHAGRWLIETMPTDWAAPRLVRWYAVE